MSTSSPRGLATRGIMKVVSRFVGPSLQLLSGRLDTFSDEIQELRDRLGAAEAAHAQTAEELVVARHESAVLKTELRAVINSVPWVGSADDRGRSDD